MRWCSAIASLGIFLEDAVEHLAVQPQDFGVGLGRGACQPRGVGDQRQFAEHGAGLDGADRNALAVVLAIEADRPLDHDIGGIGLVVFAIKLPAGGKPHGFGAEGEQTQLFLA